MSSCDILSVLSHVVLVMFFMDISCVCYVVVFSSCRIFFAVDVASLFL